MSFLRPGPLAALIVCCAALFSTHAVATEPSLASLLTAFEAVYQPPEHLAAGRAALALLQRQHEHELVPSLSLRQRSAYTDFQRLTLDLDLELVVPLFRATSEQQARVLLSRSTGHAAEERWGAMEARANFQRDLLSTSLLRELIHDVTTALAAFHAENLLPDLDTTTLLRLSHGQRELLALERELGDLHRFASGHLAELENRLRTTLRISEPPAIPSFQALLDGVGTGAPDHATCLEAAPARHLALQRQQEQLLAERLAGVLPVAIDLHASASRSYGGSYGSDSASIALRARVPLPDGWPVVGELDLSAGSFGASQQLQLSWPAPLDLSPHHDTSRATAAQLLADELAALDSALLAQRSRLAEARREVESSELQLLWLVRDVYREGVDDLATARALATEPFPDVVSELQATQVRSQLSFARLAQAEQVLDLRLSCGDL